MKEAPRIAEPAFGAATLANCEREQIHLAGSIQPHGALLVVRDADGVVLQASANAQTFLASPFDPVGARLRDFGGDLWDRVRALAVDSVEAIPIATRCDLGASRASFNALVHRAAGGELVVELEHAGDFRDFAPDIEKAVEAAMAATTLGALCDECAQLFQDLTGYDRVMVYRFDDEGHGEVFAEVKRPDLEAFRGNRYPASDIPQIARRLYERNRVRLLFDVEYEPSPLLPRPSSAAGRELDMSMCFLRSVSPIHLQYLKNMGVRATLVVSLMVGGRLWGLVSCHHYSRKFVHFEMRSVCELFAEAMGTRIAALESFERGQGELSVRQLEQRMVEAIARDGDWRGALLDRDHVLLRPLAATGAALVFESQVRSIGEAPSTEDVRDLAEWLEGRLDGAPFATANLAAIAPEIAHITGPAAGVAAARISGEPGEMLIWFRRERVRTVTWGGNPFKPPSSGDDPSELSPRRSFAQWRQVVEGTSDPWTPADLAAARLVQTSVGDVVAQFRAVRALIAKDQLVQVLSRVRSSDQHVVVADANGDVVATSGVFDMRIGAGQRLKTLDALPLFLDDPASARESLDDLRQRFRPWRAEVRLDGDDGRGAPFMVRADPVLAAPDRILGFVLMLTDLTERKAADAARRRFQDALLRSHRSLAGPLESETDLELQRLLSGLVENAQLAALEITDRADPGDMAGLLESLQQSVARSAEVLERLAAEAKADRLQRRMR